MRGKQTFIWNQWIAFWEAQMQVEIQRVFPTCQVKAKAFYEEKEGNNYVRWRKEKMFSYGC